MYTEVPIRITLSIRNEVEKYSTSKIDISAADDDIYLYAKAITSLQVEPAKSITTSCFSHLLNF